MSDAADTRNAARPRRPRLRDRLRAISVFEFFVLAVPALLLLGLGFYAASRFIQPAPPNRIVISTGADSGAYFAYARRYAEILKRDGVTLEVRTSQGSVDNLAQLVDWNTDVEVAFVQGGLKAVPAGDGEAEDAPTLIKLGAVAYEPLWVFYRGGPDLDRLAQLRGRRLAVGPPGSGTRALVTQLLEANGLAIKPTLLLPLSGRQAADALIAGRADAAFFVAAPDAPIVRELLAHRDVQVMNFVNAEAYSRRFPYLTRLTLPRSSIDFITDVPARDVQLVATTANVVAREDAHPALLYLLLQAMSEVHREPGIFQKAGEFPAPREGDFALSAESQRYFKQGLPLLQRWFPYWIANLIERLWVLILPVIAIAIPLIRILPPLYGWRIRARFFRRYGELRFLEDEIGQNPARAELERILARIETLEQEVRQMRTPLAFSDLLYTLRTHIELVRAKAEAKLERSTA
jgi:TRAP transporter TAXI family solute receptor